MQLNGKAYDALKQIAQVWLPAAGTLYFALAQIWHLPAAEEVTGTVVAVDTFLGVILGISSASYKADPNRFDGALALQDHPDGGAMIRVQGLDPEVLLTKKVVTFQVVDQTTPEAPDVASPLPTRLPPEEPPNATDPRLLR